MNRDYLKMRILLQFYEQRESGISVTALSRMLDLGKTYISKLMHELEEEGCLDLSDSRHPALTSAGLSRAGEYSEAVRLNLFLLEQSGAAARNSTEDAYLMAFYCKTAGITALKKAYILHSAKQNFSGRESFYCDEFCRVLPDGEYSLDFLIYKTRERSGADSVLSMANRGFESPMTLRVENGSGKMVLNGKTINAYSKVLNKELSGKVSSMLYQDRHRYLPCERINDVYSIPASAVVLTRVESSEKTLFHGFFRLKISCDVGIINMPQSTALCTFTI